MTTVLILVCVATVINMIVAFGTHQLIVDRLKLLQDDVSAIRIRSVPPNIGGRLAPSTADLQAARDRMAGTGRNVPDASGQVHPGEF